MSRVFRVAQYAFVIIMALIMMSPIVMVVLGSLRTRGELATSAMGLPQQGVQWENYSYILTQASFWQQARNSLLITVCVTLGVIVCSSMLAFIFSRIEFRGRAVIFNILTIGLLFPLVVAFVPVFIQVRNVGLMDSYWGVILPLVTFALPGNTVILRSFFLSIPKELEEASYLDGCTPFDFFARILLPLARPSITAVATLTIIASWNEYLLPLLVLLNPARWPLPLGIMQFQGQYGTEWQRVMAFIVLLMIPAVAFYAVAQRYIVTGLTGGELKG